jgi:hypothetical protein
VLLVRPVAVLLIRVNIVLMLLLVLGVQRSVGRGSAAAGRL